MYEGEPLQCTLYTLRYVEYATVCARSAVRLHGLQSSDAAACVPLQGYCKVADFGFAKHVGKARTFTICGTPDYQAPEVIMRRGTTKAVDYWALGVLIFEMLVGDPPFMSTTGDPWDTFRRSMTGRCQVPSFVSEQAADLIYKLLQVRTLYHWAALASLLSDCKISVAFL